MLSGALMQRAGRRRTLQLTAPLWVASWLILGFAKHFPLVLVSECCDPEIRGRLGSLPTLSMSMGILISYVAGNWLTWRYLAFFSAIFCVALFVILLPLPESPVWLESRGADASQAIKWLHLSARATATVKDDENEKQEDPENLPSLFTRKVFFSSAVIKPLTVGFALLFFQQFSGIDAVVFFTLLSNGVSTMLVDRLGRRPLLLVSAAIMCLSMVAMGSSFYFQFEQESLLGLVVFMLGFSLGFGGLPFLLLGELFPAQYRSQLSAMASAVNLLSMFSVIKSYHALEAVLTSAGTFWMYACFCALAFIFVLFVVPETKGKSLAEIEQHFRGKKSKISALPMHPSQVHTHI
ncbi:Sugar transporter [Operophtera brumata]|uniref:Sugar transporter n=1 Tax=Operophtera brumata TaxID=104452 RepID=A0A0L7LV25_OPEBR|nr:Sugar transporter [Operophtera brumata]